MNCNGKRYEQHRFCGIFQNARKRRTSVRYVPFSGRRHSKCDYRQCAGAEYTSDPDREKGFVFAPFASDTLPSVLISPSVVTAFPVSGLPEAEIPGNAPFDCGDDTGAREEYEKLVRTAVNEINEGGVKKIVASRTLRMDYRKADFAGMFAAIVRRYPEAMAYYFSHPQIGRWMGATPELLLLRRGGSLHTMSLAGTMPFSGGQKVFVGQEECRGTGSCKPGHRRGF